jgi:tetratricopeptide (TPR) repeat protein
MADTSVSEKEIEAAERLRGQGEYATALALTQDMMNRTQDDDTRMRLLLDVLYCSTRLCLDSATDAAIRELEKLPDPKMSRVFADFIQAMSFIAHGKAQKGLDLIDANLRSEYLERDDLRIWKYKHLAYKGSALIWLARPDEALVSLAQAHMIYPNGEREAAILIDQTNCLMALDRYDEAYNAASQVFARNEDEMATLAMQYMAECRLWQGRITEAGKLYLDIQKRLPCRLVNEERIKEGMSQCVASLGSGL